MQVIALDSSLDDDAKSVPSMSSSSDNSSSWGMDDDDTDSMDSISLGSVDIVVSSQIWHLLALPTGLSTSQTARRAMRAAVARMMKISGVTSARTPVLSLMMSWSR